MVLHRIDVEHRAGDILQIHFLTRQHDAAVDEAVALIEVLDELTEGLAGLIRAVEDPLLHAQEVLHLVRIIEHVDHVDVLLTGQAEGLERQKGPVQQLARDVAHGVDCEVDVDVLHPRRQQVVRGLEVHRGDHGHQAVDLVLMHRGVHQAEGTALANAEDVDLLDAVRLADVIHAAVDVAVDVVVERDGAVGLIRITPIDQIDVLPGRQQTLDGRAVFLDVGHVGPIDQGVDDQQRDRVGGHAFGRVVAIEHQLVFGVDRLLRTHAGVDLLGVEQVFHALTELAGIVQHLLGQLVGPDIDRHHHGSVPRGIRWIRVCGTRFSGERSACDFCGDGPS